MGKEVFKWTQECEFMSTSDTPNAYKNSLCCRCICTQQSDISIFSASDIGRPDGVFFHNKRISSLCGTCLHLGSVGSNHSTKNPKWQLGKKLPPTDNFMEVWGISWKFQEVVDNFMATLRSCTPHISYHCKKQGNPVFREGMRGKIRVRTFLIVYHAYWSFFKKGRWTGEDREIFTQHKRRSMKRKRKAII